MRDDGTATRRQFAAAVYAALLSPLMRVLPRAAVRLAGKGAWVSVVPAIPVLLALLGLMRFLRGRMRPGEGMANLILRVFGPILGRLVLVVYGAWFLLYAGFILRSGAERLTATVYQRSGTDPFIIVMLVLCLFPALGTLRSTARTAVLLRAILLLALGLVSVFALSNLSMKNLFPLALSEAPGIALGAIPIVTVGGAAAMFSFLYAYVEPPKSPPSRSFPTLALFAGTACLLCFETVGTFGAALTAELSYPFFTMIRDVSLFGEAQRIEAVVVVLWVFADFILCTLMLRCAHEALRTTVGLPKPENEPFFRMKSGRWLLLLEGAAAGVASRLIASGGESFLLWSETLVPLITDILVFGGFPLVWLVGKLRKKI